MSKVKFGYKDPQGVEWKLLGRCNSVELQTAPPEGFKTPDIHLNETMTLSFTSDSHIPDEWLRPMLFNKKIETVKDVFELPEGQYILDYGESRIVLLTRFENKFTTEWNDGEKDHLTRYTDIGDDKVEINYVM